MKEILLNTIVKYVSDIPEKGDFLVVGTVNEAYKPSFSSHPYNTQVIEVEKGKDFIIIPLPKDNNKANWPINGIHVYKSDVISSED